ncbi:UNVERIFIED_CONTAM: hypothetical protein Scaly_3023200 [Sesamum calycinum]|uniref:Reverse transcriptase domain-containing protein n=1 Tax=Sesamum calycinum TaxID=2727403 RepID=A0AAW2K770_9LAMI
MTQWNGTFSLLPFVCLDFLLSLSGARGLRQGDPMSPYLFVLVMEVLQMILQQFIDQDGQFLYHWRCSELKLFQLSFADDLLLLCKADVRSVSLFRRGLDVFASLSGLHTNPQKSQLIFSKAASGLRDSLLRRWGSRKATYLLAALRDGRESSFASAAYQIGLGFLGGLLGYGIYFAKGDFNEMIKRLRTFLWKGTFQWLPKGSLGGCLQTNRGRWPRFDFGIVQYGQLRKTKEHGVGGKCSHLDIRCCLISNFGWGMVLLSYFGMIRGIHWDLSSLDSPGTSDDQYWTSR